jgi:arylsulfatase A-like enzyme
MGSLLAVDDMVERVTKRLKKLGVYENTDIIFTSDNGWMLGEHRMRDPQTEDGRASGIKFFPFEGASRVPLLAAGPDFPRGRKVRGVVSNADLAPTITAIAGARARLPQDGRSLVPAARRPSRLAGRAVLVEGFENPRGAPPYTAIRTQRYRYDLLPGGIEELYDLKLDPWEMESKHADPAYAEIKAILAGHLEKLAGCRGASCQVNVGKLPAPGR